MKLKIAVLFGLLALSVNVFGQKTEPSKPVGTKPAPAAASELPTVKEILDKYIAAIGGREANEKIKTRMTKGTVTLSPMGITGAVESFAAAPNKSYTKLNLAGIGEILESFDGTIAWSINPLTGNRDKEGIELEQTKLFNNLHRELNLDKLYSKLEVTGQDKVGEKEVYVVTAQSGDLPVETYYFDKESGLILRSDITNISPEGKMPSKMFYEDYREIDSIKIPFRVRTMMPQFEIIISLTEVKNDVIIEDKLFAKPNE